MKKSLLLLFAITLGLGLKAQCPLTTAVDFTATDCHGTEVHLFDILDGGQYVLIDFFFTTCGPCQQATPNIVESYYSFGCNMHDVFYIEISVSDGDAACQNWAANYGVEYPTIGTNGGGNGICNQYGIQYYPTVILIAPNRSIVIQDLWPIGSAQAVINALTPFGIELHECAAPINVPEVTITVDQATETEVLATFTPNEFCATYYYTIATEEEMQEWLSTTALELPDYLHDYGFPGEGVINHIFSALTPNTEYTIYAVPSDVDGELYPVVQETVTTIPGGIVDIMPDFTGINLDGDTIHLYDILDNGQYVLINFFLYGDEISEAIMSDMVEAYHLYGCNDHDVFFMEISSNGGDASCQTWVENFGVEYPTISRDGGGNEIAQAIPVALYPTIMLIRPDHTIAQRDIYPPTLEYINLYMTEEGIEQHECATGVEENNNSSITLFPNPANDRVTLKGSIHGMVSVFNALGQQVESFEAEGTDLHINTSSYLNGVYFIKLNDSVLRFVVTH